MQEKDWETIGDVARRLAERARDQREMARKPCEVPVPRVQPEPAEEV